MLISIFLLVKLNSHEIVNLAIIKLDNVLLVEVKELIASLTIKRIVDNNHLLVRQDLLQTLLKTVEIVHFALRMRFLHFGFENRFLHRVALAVLVEFFV